MTWPSGRCVADAATRAETIEMLRIAINENASARFDARSEAKRLEDTEAWERGDPAVEGRYRELRDRERNYDSKVKELWQYQDELLGSREFEATGARKRIGERLRADMEALYDIDFGGLLGAGSREAVEDQAKRLGQRMRWAMEVSNHASVVAQGIRWQEDDRNGFLGGARRWADRKWHGEGYVDWADAISRGVGASAPPDFERASTEAIEARLRSYGAEVAELGRLVGQRGDEHETAVRRASFLFTTAKVAAAVATLGTLAAAGSVAKAATLLGDYFAAGVVYSGARQGIQYLQRGRPIDPIEAMKTGGEFALLGPGVGQVRLARDLLAAAAVAHGTLEIKEGKLEGLVDLAAVIAVASSRNVAKTAEGESIWQRIIDAERGRFGPGSQSLGTLRLSSGQVAGQPRLPSGTGEPSLGLPVGPTTARLPVGGKYPEIATPRDLARQSLTVRALEARRAVEAGADLYRLGTLDKSEMADITATYMQGQFWGLQHPLSPGFESAMGIPPGNVRSPDVITIGRRRADFPFVTREAPGSGTNPGGGIEVVVPPGGVVATGVFVSPPGW